jgi:Xaa-Pro aminopeptidase
VRPGIDERGLEAELEAVYKRQGAQRLAFASIIKSGPNSLWPWRILAAHNDRRNRVLRDGELVIFDVGTELDGYVSDVGRTFPVSGRFSPQQREKLEMMTRVSDAIIAAIRPGITLIDLTRIAYEAIPPAERPYMQTPSYFGHHLGLSSGDPGLPDAPLEPGMVFTVEPWYYNHDLGIAVFIEDMVLVTDRGADVLTAALPRTAQELERMVAAAPPRR